MSDENEPLDEDNEDDIELEDDSDDEVLVSPVEGNPLDYDASARDSIRKQLQSDVEAFLASGGRIHEIPPNVVSDPPRKPQSNYGGQPI